MRRAILMAALLLPRLAAAGGVVALGDERVSQYREALSAAREIVKDAPVIDPNAGDAAAQLKKADPAVILAVGQKALQVARAAAPATPTVFCMVLGGTGSRQVTGVKLEVAPAAQLQLIKQVDPQAKRIGVIYEPKASGAYLEDALKAAGNLGLTLVARPVTDAREVRSALGEIAEGIDALWLMPDPRLISAEMFNFLLVFTLEHKIALFGFLDSFTQAGALASIAPDYAEIGRKAAHIAADLAQKSPEARLPVPPPVGASGVLSVNAKTAKRLGLDIPPSALGKAKQVYR
jgi:putative tryptophan/tyrosine transport system substrate-binding protein